jgi:hypothetical protein
MIGRWTTTLGHLGGSVDGEASESPASLGDAASFTVSGSGVAGDGSHRRCCPPRLKQ